MAGQTNARSAYRDNMACDRCAERDRADAARKSDVRRELAAFWSEFGWQILAGVSLVAGMVVLGRFACASMDEAGARQQAAERECIERVWRIDRYATCGRMVGAKLVIEGPLARCVCPESAAPDGRK